MNGRLLVAHVDDLDAFVDAAIVQRHDVAARKSEDAFDAGVLQRLGRKLSAVEGHGDSSMSWEMGRTDVITLALRGSNDASPRERAEDAATALKSIRARRQRPQRKSLGLARAEDYRPKAGNLQPLARLELRSPVVAPGALGMTCDRGTCLTEAHCAQLRRVYTQVDHVLSHAIGASFAQRKVVLLATALVAVALDGDVAWTVLDGISIRLQRCPSVGLVMRNPLVTMPASCAILPFCSST